MRTTKEIQKDMQKLRRELDDALDVQYKTKIEPKMRKLVGTCYRYWNGNGSGNWWMYMIVLSYSDDRTLRSLVFERNADGYIRVEERGDYCYHYDKPFSDNYQPIGREAFDKAVLPILDTLNSYFDVGK